MRKEYKFLGSTAGKSFIILEDNKLTIKRKGFFSLLNYGLKGEKTIQISSITGTQYKMSGITNGYLQFIIIGSQESKGGLTSAQKDENAVCWAYKKCNKYAEEIINYIEKYNETREEKSGNIIKQDDEYDKLSKIKELLDKGVLSQEEFEIEKRKILYNK